MTGLRKGIRTLVCAILFATLAFARTGAQVATGTVAGSVRTPAASAATGATITLISETRGIVLAPVVADDRGDFVVPLVAADRYTLTVGLAGFKSARRTGVAVSPGDRVTLPPIVLEIGGPQETVDVTADEPILQLQTGERSFLVEPVAMERLPIGNSIGTRNPLVSLVALAPGVIIDQTNGVPATSNLISMDGVTMVDSGTHQPLIPVVPEAIAEMKVLTSAYQAEYGRSQGIQIIGVTRSGTNAFHGALYDVERSSRWDENSYINTRNGTPKTVRDERDWGLSLGGPMGRPGGSNRLFFFLNQEWRPRSAGGTTSRFRVPTDAERRGDFSQSRAGDGSIYNFIRDASTGLPCAPGFTAGCFQDAGVVGRIPANRQYAPGMAILNNIYPLPNIAQDDPRYAGNNSFNYEETDPVVKARDRQTALRLDYAATSRLRLSGKYLLQSRTRVIDAPTALGGSTPSLRIKGFTDYLDVHPGVPAASATASYVVSDKTFAEVTAGYGGNEFSNVPVYGSTADYGLTGLPLIFPNATTLEPDYFAHTLYSDAQEAGAAAFFDPATGTVQLLPTFAFGNRIANPPPNLRPAQVSRSRTYDVSATVTRLAGRHMFKAGVWHQSSVRYQGAGPAAAPASGLISFANSPAHPFDTTFGFSNVALGVFASYVQGSSSVEGRWVYRQNEFFLQDNWKATHRLTVDYGLRVVNQGAQYDTRGNLSNFLPETWVASAAPRLYVPRLVNGVPVGVDVVTGQVVPSNLVGSIVPNSGDPLNGIRLAGEQIAETNYKTPGLVWAPRVGVAYDLRGDERLVLRAATGVYYDRPAGFTVTGQLQNPPSSTAVTLVNGLLGQINSQTGVLAPPSLSTFEYETDVPTTIPWNVGVQMALPWSSTLDVTYAGAHAFNQLVGMDINQIELGAALLPENEDPTRPPSPVPGARALSTNFLRRYRGYGAIVQQSSIGYSNMHSVQTTFQRRFHEGLLAGLHYTWSRQRALIGVPRTTLDAGGRVVLREDNREANYHRPLTDRPHVMKGSFVWAVPGVPANGSGMGRVVSLLTNDWHVSGVFTAMSGTPYDIGFAYLNGVGSQNLTGSPNFPARVSVIGDPGSGCSDDPARQFNTSAFSGPQFGSDGLESGLNYLRGCAERTLDLAIARDIRLGGDRRVQIRVDIFNVFNAVAFTGRNTVMLVQSPDQPTSVQNLVYKSDGTINPGSDLPRSAGFGAVTAASLPRSIQLQVRVGF